MERLCWENRLKVSKAHSVEIRKEDLDNVDRLCERLRLEISQMRRRLARDMKLSILKSDAKKNGIAPNGEAIKAIKEGPALLSDPELSDCSDSEISDLTEALELETSSNTIIISAEELKKQLQLAGPLVIVGFLQYNIRMISVVFLGQLRELSLSSATMATSFARVTGYYFIPLELETSSNTVIISAKELKKQLQLAGPLVIVGFLQYSIRMISVVFLGQLRELSLSSATMATSFAGVTGYYFILHPSMDNPSLGPANFCTQTDALLRKNLAYQKRNKKANCRLISFPFFLCALLAVINYYARKYFKGKGLNLEPFPPGYVCPAIDMDRDTRCNIPNPPENPPMLQIPLPNDRATRNPFTPFEGLPDESCKKTNSCPATILLTGNNKTLGLGNMASNAYLEFLRGPGVKILFDFVKEMPQHPTISGGFDISYIVMFTSLVYEKQENLRIMMKMHGLGDGPYWTLSYIYFLGSDTNAGWMKWKDLNDSTNGMKELLIIMVVEWFVLLFVAYYVDQFQGQPSSSGKTSLISDESRDFDQAEKVDVARGGFSHSHDVLHREKVEQLLTEPGPNYAIVCDDLKKVYPAVDGNHRRLAIIELTEPSSGTAYVQRLDMSTDMDRIYTSMGVCLQHDLLWETLTAREHLLFYGRLKNLKGSALNQASTGLWEVSNYMKKLERGVNLHSGGVADKEAGKYSGGMKRRLSVAISLIGDPKVVYMDEPSTGLDPASRNELWNVVMKAKRDRAILLTTHSMEEVEHLCDRLGIFVDGSLQCVGNAKQVFTITTPSNYEQEVDSMVRRLFSSANKTYHISGTQKFELLKHEVRIADVFQAVDNAKNRFTVQAWGLVDTTLEDVYIKVSRGV
ncbi:unnamed protein product [Camellia sinensis]